LGKALNGMTLPLSGYREEQGQRRRSSVGRSSG